MLTPIRSKKVRAAGGYFAIVASKYNRRYVDAMLRAARAELNRARASVQIVRVPGAFEIPVVTARLARTQPTDALQQPLAGIICLGVILRGETSHAAHIGEAVSRALMKIQLRYEVPVIHEVLLLENVEQARVRCLGKTHNRGTEAAQTALAMAQIMRSLS
jgi:6,7-dimethyl-8-ribityllumazine synthase